LQVVLPQDMFHLRNGAKQRLAAGAHRVVVNDPRKLGIMPSSGLQAIATPSTSARRGKTDIAGARCGLDGSCEVGLLDREVSF
jgi:hypothetical protein